MARVARIPGVARISRVAGISRVARVATPTTIAALTIVIGTIDPPTAVAWVAGMATPTPRMARISRVARVARVATTAAIPARFIAVGADLGVVGVGGGAGARGSGHCAREEAERKHGEEKCCESHDCRCAVDGIVKGDCGREGRGCRLRNEGPI